MRKNAAETREKSDDEWQKTLQKSAANEMPRNLNGARPCGCARVLTHVTSQPLSGNTHAHWSPRRPGQITQRALTGGSVEDAGRPGAKCAYDLSKNLCMKAPSHQIHFRVCMLSVKGLAIKYHVEVEIYLISHKLKSHNQYLRLHKPP